MKKIFVLFSVALFFSCGQSKSQFTKIKDFDTVDLTPYLNTITASELSNAPNYNHPVVKAELNRIASQFAAANPDASPQEVAKAAQKYISDLQTALNPETKKGSPEEGEMDWSKYLGS